METDSLNCLFIRIFVYVFYVMCRYVLSLVHLYV
jgi:hypothetical protein